MAVRSLAIAACGLPRRKIRQRWSAKYQGGRASSVAHSPAAGVGRILIETQRGASNRSRPTGEVRNPLLNQRARFFDDDRPIGSNSAPPLPADPKRMCVSGFPVRFGSFDPGAAFRERPPPFGVGFLALLRSRSEDFRDAAIVVPQVWRESSRVDGGILRAVCPRFTRSRRVDLTTSAVHPRARDARPPPCAAMTRTDAGVGAAPRPTSLPCPRARFVLLRRRVSARPA